MQERWWSPVGAALALALGLAIWLAPAGASADSRSEARALVQKGIQRLKAEDYPAALDFFTRADAIFHSPAITYNIAQAREKLGHAQGALEGYRAYLTEDGASGKYAAAAKVAIEEIQERSAEVSVESTPPGARVVVDGVDVEARTPAAIALFPGSHTVEVIDGDWRQTKSIDVPAPRQRLKLTFAKSAPQPRRNPTTTPAQAMAPVGPGKPDGFVGAGALAILPFTFLGAEQKAWDAGTVTKEPSQPKGLLFGLALEVGLTPAPGDLVFLVRAAGGMGQGGSDAPGGDDLGFAFFGGPGFAYRASARVQAGASLAFGASKYNGPADGRFQSNTCGTCAPEDVAASDETDLAYGILADVSYSFLTTPNGEWYAGVMPVLLKATDQNVSAFFAIPLVAGYRLY